MVEEGVRHGAAQRMSQRVSQRMYQRVRRVLALVLVAAAGIAAGRLLVAVLDRGAATPAPADRSGAAARPVQAGPQPGDASVPGRSLRRAAAVLHAWDDRRAAAYARGDPAALRRLYVPGSRAGARDVQVLQAYAERGLVVRGLRTQVLSLQVLVSRRDTMRLEVTERRVGGRAVGRSLDLSLPRDGPSSRVVALHRAGDGWRVGSVQVA